MLRGPHGAHIIGTVDPQPETWRGLELLLVPGRLALVRPTDSRLETSVADHTPRGYPFHYTRV
jgi:hypothetical protein